MKHTHDNKREKKISLIASCITIVIFLCLLFAGRAFLMQKIFPAQDPSGQDVRSAPSETSYAGFDGRIREWLGIDTILSILDIGDGYTVVKADSSRTTEKASEDVKPAQADRTAAADLEAPQAGQAAAADVKAPQAGQAADADLEAPQADQTADADLEAPQAGQTASADAEPPQADQTASAGSSTASADSDKKKPAQAGTKEEAAEEKTAEEKATEKKGTEDKTEEKATEKKGTADKAAEEKGSEKEATAEKEAKQEETGEKDTKEKEKEKKKDSSPTKLQKKYIAAWEEWHMRDFPVNFPLHNYNWKYLNRDEEGKLRYEGDENYMIRRGIDVSEFQGKIDWDKVKEDGIDFVFVRAGHRTMHTGDLQRDSRAIKNLTRAKKAGLDVGAYVFSQAITKEEAREEAQLCLDVIKESGVELTLPIVFDPEIVIEDYYARINFISGKQFTDNAVAFCEKIKKAGYTPAIYANCSTETDILDMSRLKGTTIWYADYSNVPETPYDFTFWQYSNLGWVDGIPETETDLNVWFIKK